MLRDRQAPQGSYSKITTPNPYILKFSLPMSDQTYTTVFNTISLIEPSSKPKGPLKIITLPEFPTIAPDLPEKVKEIKDKPVLTEGTVEAIDFSSFTSNSEKLTDEPDKDQEDKKKKEKDENE